jgi:hypothetical protein
LWQPLATLILEASYEATLAAALENAVQCEFKGGSARVFLTALGGGAFGNSHEWISQAVDRACRRYAHSGLHVSIVCYGTPDPAIRELVDAWAA